MEFKDFYNGALIDSAAMFSPQPMQMLPGEDFFHPVILDVGAKVHPNGDVDFGCFAPDAHQVCLEGLVDRPPVPMEKHEDGTWHYLMKFDPCYCGAKAFWFTIDGLEYVSPYCPTYYSFGRVVNYVEIPDPQADFVLMRDVPHGCTVTDYFYSEVMHQYRRLLVYLPPQYEKGGEYPVLYLQHGFGENETSWTYNGKVPHIMDNLIADGLAQPFIVVMGDGMVYEPNVPGISYGLFAENMTKAIIPFIESKYRTVPDKWHRAIAGFSLGSVQSCFTGLNNPDMFAYVGLLSGFLRKVGGPLEMDMSFETHDHLKPMLNKEQFESDYKLFYRAMGTADFKYKDIFLPDDKICADNGFDKYSNYVRYTVEGYPHDWSTMRIILHDFAKRLFK